MSSIYHLKNFVFNSAKILHLFLIKHLVFIFLNKVKKGLNTLIKFIKMYIRIFKFDAPQLTL